MQSTLLVKSLSVVDFHTHKHTYIHTTHISGSLHQVINNGESSQLQQMMKYPRVLYAYLYMRV